MDNDSGTIYPPDDWNCACVHRLVEEQAARTPRATAAVYERQRLTYSELNLRANRLAHHLLGLGVGPETLVGICCHRSLEMLVGMLGILKAGCAYVALDPAYPKARQSFMMEDAAVTILLTQRELAGTLPETKAKLLWLDSDWAQFPQAPDTNPAAAVTPRNLAYILYTSGSTGQPKGVAIEHRSVAAFLSWAQSVFSPAELAGTLASTSICFDLSVFEIFVPWSSGGTVILAENALALPVMPARGEVTLVNTVPSAMSALIETGGVPANVRTVNLAGEPLSNKLVQDIYRAGTVAKVYNLYGPSEDTTYSTYALAEKDAAGNPTIGRPISNTQAYIVDEHMRQTPAGTAGQLCLAGLGLARGYLNRRELTAAKFVPNPFGAERLYLTGDLARYLPSGDIEFLGRMDHQVKVRGFRIELGEIEAALEQHPGVARAVVLALPGPQGELQLSAYLAAAGTSADAPAGQRGQQEHVTLWREVYEAAYRHAPAPEDPTFNTSGWRSSYDGLPIPEAEMREWLEQTVGRILSLRPRKVLEIGCGTGMLLARIAPQCSHYTGLDFSRAALDHIREIRKSARNLDQVTLVEGPADELSQFPAGSFDTIVINSVVQHFPDAEYLARVLRRAIELAEPGGAIFVGDVVDLTLLETLHTSVQLDRAGDADGIGALRERIRLAAAQQRDLVLAPEFFRVLAREAPAVTHVEAVPKLGEFDNELTRFRYDAILRIQSPPLLLPVAPRRDLEWVDWRRGRLTPAQTRQRLREDQPVTLAVSNIPNARLERDAEAVSWLREAAPGQTAGQLRDYLARQPARGVRPGELASVAESEGYRLELSCFHRDAPGLFHAVFTRLDQPAVPAEFPAEAHLRKLADYASQPLRARLNRELIPMVRQFLREKLPQSMIPSGFTVLEKFPLTPTGKIDRNALAKIPSAMQSANPTPPRDALEREIAGMWADALGLPEAGISDNFFELGGNSLRAVALTFEMQKRFGRDLTPVKLFELPTVLEYAEYLRGGGRQSAPLLEEGEI